MRPTPQWIWDELEEVELPSNPIPSKKPSPKWLCKDTKTGQLESLIQGKLKNCYPVYKHGIGGRGWFLVTPHKTIYLGSIYALARAELKRILGDHNAT